MLYAVIIFGALAAIFGALWYVAFGKTKELSSEVVSLNSELSEANTSLAETQGRVKKLDAALEGTKKKLDETRADLEKVRKELTDANESLRKRTELADAQALQISELSDKRDELNKKLLAAEEQIVTLAARPGVVVGESADDDAATKTLWDLELARMRRMWRTSVATNPITDEDPFDGADDLVRLAIEIEAAALREDVGAHISVEWEAKPIKSNSKRLLVMKVAQEMMATAARAPGAARFVVSDAKGGEVKMVFKPADKETEIINLIPPQITGDLIDLTDKTGLSIILKSGT